MFFEFISASGPGDLDDDAADEISLDELEDMEEGDAVDIEPSEEIFDDEDFDEEEDIDDEFDDDDGYDDDGYDDDDDDWDDDDDDDGFGDLYGDE